MQAQQERWRKKLITDLAVVQDRLANFDPGKYRTPAVAKGRRTGLINRGRRLARMLMAVEQGLPPGAYVDMPREEISRKYS